MNIAESTVLALRSLRAGRLRSFLTSIGIILGVASLIVLVGLSDGMQTKFERSIGDTARSIRVVPSGSTGTGTANIGRAPLRERDVTYLQRNLPEQDTLLVDGGRRGGGVVSNGQKKYRGTITGTSAAALIADPRKVIAGRALTDQDGIDKARVAMVGPDVVKYLFDGNMNAALGAPIRVGRQDVRIIGILEPTRDFNDGQVMMPLSTSRQFMGGTNTLTGISVVARSSHDVVPLSREVATALDAFRDIPQPSARDYWTQLKDQQIGDTNRFVSLFTLFTLGVAAISLVVGGLGVANIMFIAVKERTREIGVRKAIGARRTAIVQQFLVESTLLTTIGGLVGVALGVGLVLLGKPLLPTVLPEFGIPEISIPAILVSLGAAVLIGLFAGVLPALRASRLRPVEALRHE